MMNVVAAEQVSYTMLHYDLNDPRKLVMAMVLYV
jgi:hypothetical protein